jgi:ArsR family transcriptional regulator, arsenate/arsenite/antimonite-responsive transcriptional repressor
MKLTSLEFNRIAKALSDPQRCEMLEKISESSELSCAAICEKFPLTQATISHHLKELLTAGLVDRRKEGQFGYYRFCPDAMAAYVDELKRRMRLPEERLTTSRVRVK